MVDLFVEVCDQTETDSCALSHVVEQDSETDADGIALMRSKISLKSKNMELPSCTDRSSMAGSKFL